MAIGVRFLINVSTAMLLPAALWLQGCGMAAAPQPPSLHLPRPVHDLKAERIGNQVQLTWTMPKETTDAQRIIRPVFARICMETTSRVCATVGTVNAAPGKPASFPDNLSSQLTQGPLRVISYQVSALNPQGHTAGPSNSASTLAGAAPLPITGFTAHTVPQGILLQWQPKVSTDAGGTYRIERTLVQAPAEAVSPASPPIAHHHSSTSNLVSAKPSPSPQQTLLVSAGTANAALDTSIQWNAPYSYTIARVAQLAPTQSGSAPIRISSEPSSAVTLFARDTFPPAAPQRLVAVVVSGTPPLVDLSWSPSLEPDFAHYQVSRRDLSSTAAPTPLASPQLVTPTFRDPSVAPGHRYAYSVRALDTNANASAPSSEALVEIPNP